MNKLWRAAFLTLSVVVCISIVIFAFSVLGIFHGGGQIINEGGRDHNQVDSIISIFLENPFLATLFAGIVIAFITFGIQWLSESVRDRISDLEKKVKAQNSRETIEALVQEKIKSFQAAASRVENKIDTLYDQPFFRELGEFSGVHDFPTASAVLKSAIFLVESKSEEAAHEWVYSAAERIHGQKKTDVFVGTVQEFRLLAEFCQFIIKDMGLAWQMISITGLAHRSFFSSKNSSWSSSQLELSMLYLIGLNKLGEAEELAKEIEHELFMSIIMRVVKRGLFVGRHKDLRYSIDAYRALIIYYDAIVEDAKLHKLMRMAKLFILHSDYRSLEFLIEASKVRSTESQEEAFSRFRLAAESQLRGIVFEMRGADVRRLFKSCIMAGNSKMANALARIVIMRKSTDFDAQITALWFKREARGLFEDYDIQMDAGIFPISLTDRALEEPHVVLPMQ